MAVNSKNLVLNKKLPLKFQINLVVNKTSIFLVDKTTVMAVVPTKLNLLVNKEKKYRAKLDLKSKHNNNRIGLKMLTLLTTVVILPSSRSDKLNLNINLKFKKNPVLYCGHLLVQERNQANNTHLIMISSTHHHAWQQLNTHNLLNMKCMKCQKRHNSNTTISISNRSNSTLGANINSSNSPVKCSPLLLITDSVNVLSLAKILAQHLA